jgi:SAM-dependent methyltransferase
MNAYCIKDSYVENSNVKDRHTIDPKEFWTPQRKEAVTYYQWHAYSFAGSLLRKNRDMKSVVDLGCGTCSKLQKLILPYCYSLVGLDNFERDKSIINCPSSKFSYQQVDLEKPRPLNATFDLIICVDVIEHLHNPNILLDYIKSMSKENSFVVLSTPERDLVRGTSCNHSPNPDHVREWNKAEFREYIESRGFVVHKHFLAPFMKFSPKKKFFRIWLHGVLQAKRLNTCQVLLCSAT